MKEADDNTFAQMLLVQTDVKLDVHICHDRSQPGHITRHHKHVGPANR
jgi:hypothetical protein